MKPASHEPRARSVQVSGRSAAGGCGAPVLLSVVAAGSAGGEFHCSTAAAAAIWTNNLSICQDQLSTVAVQWQRVGDIAVPGNWGPGGLRKPDLKNCPTP